MFRIAWIHAVLDSTHWVQWFYLASIHSGWEFVSKIIPVNPLPGVETNGSFMNYCMVACWLLVVDCWWPGYMLVTGLLITAKIILRVPWHLTECGNGARQQRSWRWRWRCDNGARQQRWWSSLVWCWRICFWMAMVVQHEPGAVGCNLVFLVPKGCSHAWTWNTNVEYHKNNTSERNCFLLDRWTRINIWKALISLVDHISPSFLLLGLKVKPVRWSF